MNILGTITINYIKSFSIALGIGIGTLMTIGIGKEMYDQMKSK